jgi:hypothetical protein
MLESGSVVTSFGGGFYFVGAGYIDQVNASLASYFGLPGGMGPDAQIWTGTFNFSFMGTDTGGVITATGANISGGDFDTHAVPEPSSLVLTGLGALGMLVFGPWRRMAAGA